MYLMWTPQVSVLVPVARNYFASIIRVNTLGMRLAWLPLWPRRLHSLTFGDILCDDIHSDTLQPAMSDATLTDLPDLPSSTAVPGVTTSSSPASTSTQTSTAHHSSSNIAPLLSFAICIVVICLF
jgi:hypothetical protein